MKQLTGLDGSFLYMETATSFGHVSGLAIYQRPNAAFDPYVQRPLGACRVHRDRSGAR